MNRTLKKALIVGAALLPLVMVGSVYAGPTQEDLNQPVDFAPIDDSQFSGLPDYSLAAIISGLLTLAFVLAAIVAFAFLVLGGIQWITSGGDKTKTESARNMITAALVGLLIVFAAWAILSLISILFDIDIFNLELPTIVGGDGA
ncbi:pilin, partial [Patescibacteria group bacterium]|nr:pilin [Patescibacteria group bacterium]